MAKIIVQSALVVATAADILQGTRLQTVPGNGVLTFEVASDLATAAANLTTTIQLPNGDTPLNGVLVPASGVVGQLDDRNKLVASFMIAQGGHPVFAMTVVGAAIGVYRVTFRPNR